MNIAVIGMGLIGGSLLRALAEAGHWIVGYDLDPATRAQARTAAALAPKTSRWQVAPSVGEAVRSADLAVIATPLTAVAPLLDELAGVGFAGLVTDVVSVKEPVRQLVARRLRAGGLHLAGYVGGHPMAGREVAGFAATDPGMFHGCSWVLCLDDETNLDDWLMLARLITGLGARVVPTTAEDHDRVVAAVSHVPHLIAAALATAVADPLAATLAAGSFRDGTRVAASPPELIAAMCGGNAGLVLDALDAVMNQLDDAREALEAEDPIAAIRRWAAPAHAARTTWPPGWGAPKQIPATPDDLLTLGDEGGWVIAVSPDGRTVTAARPV
ncbi:MAG TPA: prephenate dehydrogenase/arogenate dehydrogenase family protein [Micromonosporaceae bacterium]